MTSQPPNQGLSLGRRSGRPQSIVALPSQEDQRLKLKYMLRLLFSLSQIETLFGYYWSLTLNDRFMYAGKLNSEAYLQVHAHELW